MACIIVYADAVTDRIVFSSDNLKNGHIGLRHFPIIA